MRQSVRNASSGVIWDGNLGSVLCSGLAADPPSLPAAVPALPHLSQQLLPSLAPLEMDYSCPGWQSPAPWGGSTPIQPQLLEGE